MRFSRSTHLLMCLSLETLTSIIWTGSLILVELIDLVNSVIIFLSEMTIVRWLTFLVVIVNFPIPDCDSHNPALLDLFLSIGNFWSCCCLSLRWLSNKPKSGCPVSSHSLLLFWRWLGWPSAFANDYREWFQVGIDDVSLIVRIRSSLTHLHGF